MSAIVEPGDLRGAAILAAAFLSLLVLAELWRRFGHPKPEWTRKLVHLGGGMLLLANSLEDGARFFSPYLAASAAVLAFSLDTGVFRLERRKSGVFGALGLALLGTALAVLGPALARWPPPWPVLPAILATTAVVTLANAAIELRDPKALRSRDWTAWRFLLSFIAAGAILGLQALGTIPLWDPGSGV